MNSNYYKRGAYNVICDSCGFKFKNGELRERWDGVMCCSECWTPRQPQDLIRARKENLQLPYVRPRPADEFIPINYTAVPVDYVTVTDLLALLITSQFGDTVTIADALGQSISPGFIETSTVSDALTVSTGFNRDFSETMTTTDVFDPVINAQFAINGMAINSTTIG